ncbi:uncharacterized protein [Typha angustifolia]|uniref:uncharacterized protein isoform X3 n=1 Tax=Typha angustifolia TaxID=59011 RepID=UPI003C2D9E22
MEEELGSSSRAIDSSNVGFQLLKKCGWKEGTGLGASEQGRLEPLQTHVKKNKRGLGAEKVKQKLKSHEDPPTSKVSKNLFSLILNLRGSVEWCLNGYTGAASI